MLRIRWLLLLAAALLASVTAAQVKYFPPDFERDQYAKYLLALGEPSLWESSRTLTTQSYRFLWLRTFDHPVAIRIDIRSDGTSLLTAKMTNGAGGYEPGKPILNKTRNLTPEQTNRFLRKIESDNFWKLSSIENKKTGVVEVDGAQWIIEGTKNGAYHVVDRWSPDGGAVRDLGLFMAKELAKIKIPAKEVY